MDISFNRAEFAARLKFIREKNGVSIKQACAGIGVALSTYYGYENATRIPNAEILHKIVVFYDVDPLYLLGIYDFPYSIRELSGDEEFVKKYNSLPEYCQRYVLETMDQVYENNCKNIKSLSEENK